MAAVVNKDNGHYYCCHGCLSAAQWIQSAGLDDFYRLRELSGGDAAPKPSESTNPKEWRDYDRLDLLDNYSHNLGEQGRSIRLAVPQLYCNACSWLLDRSLSQLDGVDDIWVNGASRQATINWRQAETPLSEILALMASLGYPARPLADSEYSVQEKLENRAALKRLAVAGLGMMQIMTYAFSLYLGAFQGIEAGLERFFHLTSLLLATAVVFYSAAPFFQNAWSDIKHRRAGMDVPVALAIGGAYLASVIITLSDSRQAVYFDSAVMFTFFLSLGRYWEMRIRHRALSSVEALQQLLPPLVTVSRSGESLKVAPNQLKVGDSITLKAGDVVPADAIILEGDAQFDEALLTGEATPQHHHTGQTILSGAILLHGLVSARITHSGQNTTLSQLRQLIEQSRRHRPAVALLADRVAHYFVGTLLLMTSATGLAWYWIDPSQVLPNTLAMLVVTCPCALSLAIPAALTAAGHGLSHQGILLANPQALEILPSIDHWFFDKTGTLTTGKLRRQRTIILAKKWDEEAVLAIASTLEKHSEHPIASAFSEDARFNENLQHIHAVANKGIEAQLDQQRLRIGHPLWASAICQDSASLPQKLNTFRVVLCHESGPIAGFEIEESVRPQAKQCIQQLQSHSSVSVLSGDEYNRVLALANTLNIDATFSAQSPEEKVEIIKKAQQNGLRVAMVGDGANDAPSLAQADVTIAMSNGNILAQSTADIILLNQQLSSLPILRDIARQTRRIIRQNLGWAIGYNLLALPLAAFGYIAPWAAAIGMSVSSLLVVLNSARLQRTVTRQLYRLPSSNHNPQRTESALP